jgi:hypothetical protein
MHKPLENDLFQAYHCGACMAYGLMTPDSETRSFQTLQTYIGMWRPATDKLIFLFGEIDCRILVYYKSRKSNMPINDVIDMVAYRYLAAVLYWKGMGFNVAVHGVIPACRQGNDYGVEFYGPQDDRCLINAKFDDAMNMACIQTGIPYFSVFNHPELRDRDDEGMLQEYLLPDLVHVDPTKCDINRYFSDWMGANYL